MFEFSWILFCTIDLQLCRWRLNSFIENFFCYILHTLIASWYSNIPATRWIQKLLACIHFFPNAYISILKFSYFKMHTYIFGNLILFVEPELKSKSPEMKKFTEYFLVSMIARTFCYKKILICLGCFLLTHLRRKQIRCKVLFAIRRITRMDEIKRI